MKVHGKTSPLPEDFDSDDDCHSNEESLSSPTAPIKPIASDTSTPTQPQPPVAPAQQQHQTSNASSPTLSVHSHALSSLPDTHPNTKFSEWYVCQSATGMPTPPSNEHSPIGGLGSHMHSHLPSLHPPSLVQYS